MIIILLFILLTAELTYAQIPPPTIVQNPPKLTWQDNSDNEDGFKIERNKDNGPFAQIAVVPANTVVYLEPSQLPDGTYCYRLLAYNSGGSSPYSDTACGTVVVSTKPMISTTKTPSRYKFTITGNPPDTTGGWTAIFFRNSTINLGSDNTAPYSRTVELSCGLIYDFWITWIKTGVPSVNSQHQIMSCP